MLTTLTASERHASFVIFHDRKKLLLVVRKDGRYGFPGGKVETNETPHAAAIREVAEELGVTISPTAIKPLHKMIYPDTTLLVHTYACELDTGSLGATLGTAATHIFNNDELAGAMAVDIEADNWKLICMGTMTDAVDSLVRSFSEDK